MAWTLRGSKVILLCEMMNLRRHPTVTHNTHLKGFKRMLYWQHRWKMIRKSSRCWVHFLDQAVRSSKYVRMIWARSWNMNVMDCWKVAPPFLRPKGMTQYAKVPQGVVNTVFYWSARWIWIWLYLEKLSMKDKASWPAQSSIIWSIKGVGKMSLGQAWLRSRKSVQTQIVPFFFLTGMGLETHDVYAMGYMNPTTRNLSILALMAASLDGCSGHYFWRIGVISG